MLGFPDSSVGKESACNAGDLGSIPGLGRRSAGEGNGDPLRGEFQEGLQRVDTTERLSNFHFCNIKSVHILVQPSSPELFYPPKLNLYPH